MVLQHLAHNVDSVDPTLHLPRILCLHGGGTNARIFRSQCRVIRASLRNQFRLVFAEGPFLARPGPDVTSRYEKHGPFRGWLLSAAENASGTDSELRAAQVVAHIQDALHTAICADDLQGATGEVVGLLGFSQGAKVAASILYAQQVCQQHLLGSSATVWPDFRFAVLMAGRGPLVWLLPGVATPPGFISAAQPATAVLSDDGMGPAERLDLLQLPTLHVHGLHDTALELHRRLLKRYFRADSVSLLEWQGGHRVPIRTLHVDELVEGILKVAREAQVLGRWTWWVDETQLHASVSGVERL
jgi:predicted esterase